MSTCVRVRVRACVFVQVCARLDGGRWLAERVACAALEVKGETGQVEPKRSPFAGWIQRRKEHGLRGS
jgi:hypothetical protein